MKTILVVDDTPININFLKNILSNVGYNVKVANSGQRALDLVVKKPTPDLILLDVMMPDMDGYEVCRRLKKDESTQDIPIIFVTAKDAEHDEEVGFELGAVDYITKPISTPITLARVKTHLDLTKMDKYNNLARGAIYMLAEAGHYNDTDTGCHIWRMAAYAKELALQAGWEEEDAEQLELTATMHDTGKIGIDDDILKAPRALTKEEWVYMKTHTTIGSDILKEAKMPLFDLSAQIARWHHEKWDGTGYPDGLKKQEIPQSARIVAIADVFDALTTKRCYKEPWSVDEAFDEIEKQAGTQFDPELIAIFLKNKAKIIEIKNRWNELENENCK